MNGRSPRGSSERIRRLQRLQVVIVTAIALLSVLAAVFIARSILATGSTREEAEDAEHALLDLRTQVVQGHSDYWRGRAEGGGPGIPPELRSRFVAGRAALESVIASRSDKPDERAAIERARAAATALGRVVLTDTSDLVAGSARERRFVAAADAAIADVERVLSEWLGVLEGEVTRQAAADERLTVRLLAALGGLVALLVGSGVLLWAVAERARRASVAEIAGERDATLAVMASVQDGVAVLDSRGEITEANERLAALLGLPRQALIGRSAPWAASLPPGFVGEIDLQVARAEQAELPVLLTSSLLAGDQGLTGSVHILKDMTERVRAEVELRERASEQEVLSRVATLVARGAEPGEVFDLVAREVAMLLRVEVGVVTRFDSVGDRGIDVGVWTSSDPEVSDPPGRVPLDGSAPVAIVYRTGTPSRVDDLMAIDATSAAAFAAGGFVAGVSAPVAVGAVRWGAVSALTRRHDTLPAGTEKRIGRFAELVGLTVANADARARLASQAATDPLTGLANHRSFHERLEQEVAAAKTAGDELALVVFDLDRFKEVNDAFGHQVGDDVLAEAARRLAGEARFGELVARVGGEEFAWIMPGSDGINAWRAAERARRAVAATPFGAGVGYVTASAGVADLTQAKDAATLMRLADGALYWAKAHGRNVTLRYSPEVVRELSATERADRLARSQGVTALRALARAVDAKDPSTARHAERVAAVALRLASELGWTQDRLLLLEEAALLHDVGKIGVPDALLFTPGPLSATDAATVRQHATLGAEIVSDVLTPEQVSWVRGHHERWNGSGYPAGIAGDEIPDGARVIAVADAWDAMTSVRAYGAPRTFAAALAELTASAGRHFDPDVVDALQRLAADGRLTVTDVQDGAERVRASAGDGAGEDAGDPDGLSIDAVPGGDGAAELGSGRVGEEAQDPVRD